MSAPGAPKSKKTVAKTVDPEPMKGLTPVKKGYVTPKKDDEDFSPAKEVDLGKELTEEQKDEMARIGSRQEELEEALKNAKGGKSRKSRKHKKSKKTRKTRKHKKHGKRRA